MTKATAAWCVALVVGVAGCAPEPWTLEGFKSPVNGGVKRAAYELDCPENQLRITDLGDSAMGVSGCGKKAVYKWAMGAGWVNNSGADQAPEKK